MFLVWRRFVVWLRNLLLKLSRKDKVEWDKEIIDVLDIIDDAIPETQPETKPELQPETKPEPPKYDIIGTVDKKKKKPLFWWLRRKK